MIYLNLLLICLFWVLVTDYARFGESIEEIISRRKGKKITLSKIFKCSLCQSWWTSLLYLIITSNISVFSVVAALFFACSTTLIYDTVNLLYDLIIKINSLIRDLLKL